MCRKNILDIDNSKQVGSVTYVIGVGAELVGGEVKEVWEVVGIGEEK